MATNKIERAADLLLGARRSRHPVAAIPMELTPATVEEAYAIQDLVTAQLGRIGGWKTAPSKDGIKFNWAPIPEACVFGNGAEISLADFLRSFLELEIGFILRSDLPPRDAPYLRHEVVAAVAEMRVCLELFASRYADRASRTAVEQLADAQNAAGVVVGSGLAEWQGLDLELAELSLDYAGQHYVSRSGRPLDDLLDALTDLANGTGRLGGLRAGQVIITGARIGPIPASSAGFASGKIEPVGSVGGTFI
ncbi:MAG: hypothetical protein WD942_09475 [Dehalococcoidia bacterium]